MNNDGNPKETNQFWQSGSVALRYLDCTKLGKTNSPNQRSLISRRVMTTAATFATHSVPWVNNIEWHTINADEGQHYLRGQHNKPMASLRLGNWYVSRSTSSFVLSGTPFVTNIAHDAVHMIEAIASPLQRKARGPEYTSMKAREVFDSWNCRRIDAVQMYGYESQSKPSYPLPDVVNYCSNYLDWVVIHRSTVAGKEEEGELCGTDLRSNHWIPRSQVMYVWQKFARYCRNVERGGGGGRHGFISAEDFFFFLAEMMIRVCSHCCHNSDVAGLPRTQVESRFPRRKASNHWNATIVRRSSRDHRPM